MTWPGSAVRRPSRQALGVIVVASLVLALGAAVSSGEMAPVRVRVIEDRISGRMTYRYAIENNSRRHSIVAFRIGEDPHRRRGQLRQPPFGWTDEKGLPLGSALAPDGWTVEAVREDDAPLWFVDWFTGESDDSLDIAPGEMRDGFGLLVFDTAPDYVSSSWTVVFDDGRRFSGTLERDLPTP